MHKSGEKGIREHRRGAKVEQSIGAPPGRKAACPRNPGPGDADLWCSGTCARSDWTIFSTPGDFSEPGLTSLQDSAKGLKPSVSLPAPANAARVADGCLAVTRRYGIFLPAAQATISSSTAMHSGPGACLVPSASGIAVHVECFSPIRALPILSPGR